MLALSFVPFLAIQQASALSAITFTNETTVESQGEQFQQVYENGTSSSVFLDTNSSGFYFMDSWDGTTLTSLNSTLTNSTYLVDAHAYISPVDLSRYWLNFASASSETVTIANEGNFDYERTDPFSACVWFQSSTTTAQHIISKTDTSANNRGWRMSTTGAGTYAVGLVSNEGTNNQLVERYVSVITDGTARLLCFTYDGTSTPAGLKLYVNGVEVATNTDANNLSDTILNNVALRIASRNAASLFVNGNVDEPMVWSQELSAAEILQVYNGEIVADDLELWADFNDGIGTSALDRSGNGNTGTLVNTPTWTTSPPANSHDRPTIYVTGRDSDDSTNGVAKWNLADLSEVDDEYFSSDLAPLDIAQSTSNLYSTAINATSYGTLFDVALTRSFGSYTETSILSGTVGTPAVILHMDQATGTTGGASATGRLSSADNSIIGELAKASSVLVGDSFFGITLSLAKTGSPTGTATIGVFDASGATVYTCNTLDVATLTTLQADYSFLCGAPHTIAANQYIGITYTGGDGANYVGVYRSDTDTFDGTNSVRSYYNGAWNDENAQDMRMKIWTAQAKTVVYDGSPDTRYHFFDSNGTIKVVKRTGSTSLLAMGMSHTAGQPFSVIQLTDRIIIQTATDTYQLLTATDAITQLHDNSFNTRYPQTFSIAPAARTFNSLPAYIANSTYAENWTPDDGEQEQTAVFIDSVTTGGSGSIAVYDPTKYYYLPENDLTVEASDTTWTIKDVGSREAVTIAAYTESLGIDLDLNTTAVLASSVITASCDNGNYLITLEMYAVGSDADCNLWRILAESGDTIGRELSYTANVEAVHADPYTTYGFELETTNPAIYSLTSIYDDKTVDMASFDSGGQAQQRYLFGQCYRIEVTDENTGEVALAGNACANDFTTKTISLTGIVIPDPLVKATWNYEVSRNSTDPLNNVISGNVSKSTTPFNATIYVADHFIGAYKTFEQTLNFTNVNIANFTISGITENQTLYFTVTEGDDNVLNFQSQGNFVTIDLSFLDTFGEFFGIPIAGVFVILFAGLFTKSNAYFGVFATAAVVGVMSVMGMLDIASNLWTLILIIAALGMFGARRFL